ncbi:hypothetical protein ABQJ54_09270 [Rhodanobacter sp. Si-c]|uniref:Uncharacterized protein n=1 Tax=Rhodanobacter lycopersici TaxID=3162487 RepID=A0ABV3QDN3_9GAMM
MTSSIVDNRFEQGRFEQGRRRGVRRTVTVLAIVVGAFYLLSFVQILLMK